MKRVSTTDGFGYDLDRALKEGNIFEKIFHSFRISPWLTKIDYSGKKVLDVGCNTGILLIPLLERGVDVVGVDIDREDVEKVKEKLKVKRFPLNRAQIADARELPFSTNSFDIVLLSDILEHVGDPKSVAKEAQRVVKRGGLIYATVPNEWHPVVKFSWLRKALSGRSNVDEHPDVPYNFKKFLELFPDTVVEDKKLAGLGVQLFCVFRKPGR